MKKIISIILLFSSLGFSNGISFENRDNNFSYKYKNNIETKEHKFNKNININNKKIMILKKAKKLLGKKYLWGAKVGDLNNFDCSSFVKELYKEIGINLPRVSRDQSKIGQKISLNNLEIGDLIFFNTIGDYVSHVGIYIGNNKFIHASSKAKKTIVSEFSGYYRQKAIFGTRIN